MIKENTVCINSVICVNYIRLQKHLDNRYSAGMGKDEGVAEGRRWGRKEGSGGDHLSRKPYKTHGRHREKGRKEAPMILLLFRSLESGKSPPSILFTPGLVCPGSGRGLRTLVHAHGCACVVIFFLVWRAGRVRPGRRGHASGWPAPSRPGWRSGWASGAPGTSRQGSAHLYGNKERRLEGGVAYGKRVCPGCCLFPASYKWTCWFPHICWWGAFHSRLYQFGFV